MIVRKADQPVADLSDIRPFPLVRSPGAKIVVLCEPPTRKAVYDSLPMPAENFQFLAKECKAYELGKGDLTFVQLCPPMPPEISKSAAKKWAHVEPGVPEVLAKIRELSPKLLITFGELASRVAVGRAVKITKARGVIQHSDIVGCHVLPMLSPSFVERIPDNLPAFRADLNTLARFRDADFDISQVERPAIDYRWVFDFDEVADQVGDVLSVDTETTGLRWHDEATRVLTIQFSPKPGVSWVFPVDAEYCAKWFPDFSDADRVKLVARLKEVLEDGAIKKIGFNIKYDNALIRKMGIEVQGWFHDAQLLAFGTDENMLRKDLNECIRIWVADMAGYADEFDATTDKSRMIDVDPQKLLPYAGGDTDAVFRLVRQLDSSMRRDSRQYNCYRRVQLPAIMVFANSVERYGQLIDKDKLVSMQAELEVYVKEQYRKLIRMVPAEVRRKHLKDGLSFTRSKFMKDILFSKEGFNLTPIMFTESTRDLPPDQREPMVGKDHLTYFVNHPNKNVADFCTGHIQYNAAQKMLSTYVGAEEEGSGFHKYIAANGRIYPSYKLHGTNTGRTSSSEPNGQNFPKRSPPGGPNWAKQYQGIFMSSPGYTLVNVDLSQIELRLVAWMANERRMLQIYRDKGDIHTGTARDVVMRISPEAWLRQEKATIKLNRTKAKAVNFGLIYGMSATGFQVYAKTDYNIDLTLEEAENIRNRFFDTYPDLIPWHRTMKSFAHQNGYVRSLHGAVRHLPSIFSNDRGIVAQAERQAVNAPIQRMGSDLGLVGMIRFASQADPEYFRLIGFVHDALVLECKDGYAEQGAAHLKWVMQSCPFKEWFGITPPLPILADAEIATGRTADTLEERQDIEAIKPDWWDDDEERAIHAFVYGN